MKNNFQTGKVVTVSFGHLLHDTYAAFLAPMLPLLITKLGMSLSLAGMLDVIRKIPSLFNPFIGLLADKICVKYFVIFTPGLSAVMMSLLGLSPTYTVLFILLFVTGISSTLFHVPAPVLVKHFSGNRSGTGMSYFMFGGELARTLGPLLITAAISLWGLEGAYRLMPIGIIASFILYIKLRNISSIHENKNRIPLKGARETAKELVPFFIAIAAYQLFRAAMKSALTLYLPTYLIIRGQSLWMAGGSLAVLQFAGAAGTFAAGYIADRMTHRKTLFIAGITSPFIMLAFIRAGDVFTIPILIFMGFLLFAPTPVILALVQNTNTARPAFVNGIYMTLNFSISSLMVLVVGILGDHIGLEATFKISAVMAILSVPFLFILPRDRYNNN